MYSQISQIINARPEQINTLLSEQFGGFNAIAPRQYFLDMQLREDQEQIRNIVTVRMNLSGALHQFEEFVSEPIPLRTIVEYDPHQNAVIVIVVEATSSVDKIRVSLYTIDATSPFLADFIGVVFVPASLTRIYNEESRNLNQQIQELAGMLQAS